MLILEIAVGILLALAVPIAALIVFRAFSTLLEGTSNVIHYRQNKRDRAQRLADGEAHARMTTAQASELYLAKRAEWAGVTPEQQRSYDDEQARIWGV